MNLRESTGMSSHLQISQNMKEDAQDAGDLEGIVEDCMDWWSVFEDAIMQVKGQLSEGATA